MTVDAPRPLDVLVVDDEPLARRGVRELLREMAGVGEVREAPNGAEAVRLIRERRPDLVFLDVQMPRVDGFAVIEAVGAAAMPPVIFVTAYDEHALRAFEVHAVDYLLKPIDPERFRDAVERARLAVARDETAALRAALAAVVPLIRQARAAAPDAAGDGPDARQADQRIPVRDRGRIVFVHPAEIDWLEAQGNYVRLHLRGGTVQHRATMDEMEARLGPAFLRIRRSVLVRSAAIRYCEPMGKGSYVLGLYDQTRLTSSRYYRDRLAPLLGE